MVLSSALLSGALIILRPKEILFQWDYLKILPILLASVMMGAIISPINPTSSLFKIMVILLGAATYILFLFMFKVFNKEEKDLIGQIYGNLKSLRIFSRNQDIKNE